MTETIDTDGQGPQSDSPDNADTGQDDGGEHTAPDTDDQEHDDGDDDGDQDSGGRGEARQRRRAQRAERERDELRDTLQRTRQAVVDNAVSAAHMDPRLLAAAGHTLDSLVGDDGLIDHDTLAEAITATRREFRVSNGLQPNPQQGRVGGQGRGTASWSKALKSG